MRRPLILAAYAVGFGLALPAALLGLGLLLDRLLALPPAAAPFAASLFPMALGAFLWLRGAAELLRVGKGPPVSALPPATLVETGPFFYVRHPLYIGFQLLLVGVSLAIRSAGCLLTTGPLFLLLWIGYALLYEEPALTRRFGAAYARYRGETGLLFPSLPVAAHILAVPLFRAAFGARLHGTGSVPPTGGLILFSLHRSYLDPLLMAVGLRRRVHYLTTTSMFRNPLSALLFRQLGCIPLRRFSADAAGLRRALALVASGGALGVFPEGRRSWAGETVCDPAVFRFLESTRVPLVSAEIEGGYEYYPRFASRPRARRLTLRYRVYQPARARGRPTGAVVEGIVRKLVERERRSNREIQARRVRQPARDLEMVLYSCPRCQGLFCLRGSRDGSVRCGRCESRFVLVEGKALLMPEGSTVPLEELYARALDHARGSEAEGMWFPGLIRPMDLAGLTLVLRVPARLSFRAAGLEIQGPPDLPRELAWDSIDSVLIEGSRKLEILYRRRPGVRELIQFTADPRHPLFLEHALRLRAFGDPDCRFRGALRRRIEPG